MDQTIPETIQWEAPEYHHHEKSADWYWAIGIIALSIAVLSIIFQNILFSIFIILAAIVMTLYAYRKPRIVPIEVNSRGIQVDKTLYSFDALESFWIEADEYHPQIIVKSKKMMMPYIVVPIGDINPDEVRTYLLMHLKEVEHHEPLGQKLMEYLGF